MRPACTLFVLATVFATVLAGGPLATAAPAREGLRARFAGALAHENAGRCQVAARRVRAAVARRLAAAPVSRLPRRRLPPAAGRSAVRRSPGPIACPPGSVPEAESALIRLDALVGPPALGRGVARERALPGTVPGGAAQGRGGVPTALAIEAQGRAVEAARLAAEDLGRVAQRHLEPAGRGPPGWRSAPGCRWQGKRRAGRRAAGLGGARHGAVRSPPERGVRVGLRRALERAELTPPLACKARFHLAQSVWKQRKRTRAPPLFAEAEQAASGRATRDTARPGAVPAGPLPGAHRGREAGAGAEFARAGGRPRRSPAGRRRPPARRRGGLGGRATSGRHRAGRRRCPTATPTATWWARPCGAWPTGPTATATGRGPPLAGREPRLVPRASIWYAEGRAEYWEGRILEKQGDRAGGRRLVRAARCGDYPLSVYALLAVHGWRRVAPPAAAALQRAAAPPRAVPRGAAPGGGAPGRRGARRWNGRSSWPPWGWAARPTASWPASPARPRWTARPDRHGGDAAGRRRHVEHLPFAGRRQAGGVPPLVPRRGAATIPGCWPTRAPSATWSSAQPGQRGPARAAARPDARGERVQSARRVDRQLPGPHHAQALDGPGPAVARRSRREELLDPRPTSRGAPGTWPSC